MSFERLSLSIIDNSCPAEMKTLADLGVVFNSDIELLAMDFENTLNVVLDTGKLSSSTLISDLQKYARSVMIKSANIYAD